MLVLYFLMGALALLVTVLLFGFVGCKPFGAADTPNPEPPAAPPGPAPGPGSPPPPDYGQYGNWVTRTKDLVAYWRLGEPSGTTVLKASDPIPAGAVKTAKDTFNGYDGYYFSLNPAANPDNARHSPKTAGTITLGVTPGLLEVAPQDNYSCIQVDGGFVQVGWDNHLNPQAFTLEAWVYPDSTMYNPAPGASQFYCCLAESAGPKGLGQKKTGWGLYLGPETAVAPLGKLFWQVWMGDGATYKRVAIAKPNFPKDSKGNVISQFSLTYLALTFDGNQGLELWLYYPGKDQDMNSLNEFVLRPITTPLAFHPNDGSAGGKGEFVIGAGSNLFPNVSGTPSQRLYPFRGKIQEVALYKSAVDHTTLESHEMAGGNL
jgi:hypothetical protein